MRLFIERRAGVANQSAQPAAAGVKASEGSTTPLRGWLMAGQAVDASRDTLGASGPRVEGQLTLTYEERTRSRLRATTLAGEDVGLDLPRGTVLRHGDRVVSAQGEALEVLAKPEDLIEVRAADALTLSKIAYHLGNRHVPVQIGIDAQGQGYLRLQPDHVLQGMIERQGGQVSPLTAAFDPESGAYGYGGMMGHSHGIGGAAHEHGPGCSHDHEHGPDCDHDHSHEHEHHHHHHKADDPHEQHVHGPGCGHDHSHDHAHAHGPDRGHDHGHAPHQHHVHGPECDHDHPHEQPVSMPLLMPKEPEKPSKHGHQDARHAPRIHDFLEKP